jgi:selenide,water dikinase
MKAVAPPVDVVLVGAGHAHVQVLRRQLMAPLPGARVTLVVDRPVAVYSGMLPGLLSGRYRAHELEVDALPLARRAGVRVLVAAATGVDAAARRLHLEGRPPLPYDVASLDVGSTVAGLDTPGVREHAVPTRPIAAFDEVTTRAFGRLRGRRSAAVVVVGAGAAGTELAFCAQLRLRAEGVAEPRVTVVDAGDRWARGRSAAAGARVAEAARERGLTLRAGRRAARVEADAVHLDDGEVLPADLVLWVTGAVGSPWLAASGLPVDALGFVRVADTLAVHGAPGLFAVGDCAVPDGWPEVPKAGVHAVRAGPVLIDNLRAAVTGGPLRPYVPQRDYFALLDLGDGRAVGDKWGVAARGAWLQRWKERIDRRFVERFQVLGPDGAPALAFGAGLPVMAEVERPCGGCGAKVGPAALSAALREVGGQHPDVVLGVADREDVGVVRLAAGEVAVSVDGFPAFCDDPWRVGHAAARNATSDLWCKGLRPRAAVAWVTVPEATAAADLPQVLAGLRAALDDEGVPLLGGHTTTGPVLAVGLTVLGDVDRPLWRQGGLSPGDALVVTRPLGSGVVLRADLDGLAPSAWVEATWAAIARGNRRAAEVAARSPVRAATDVTGFGLAGHLGGMLRASGCGAEVVLAAVPALPGARELLARGLRATAHGANRLGGGVVTGPALADPAAELLFDPQTGGGLLLGVPESEAAALVAALREVGEGAAVVGRAVAGPPELTLR